MVLMPWVLRVDAPFATIAAIVLCRSSLEKNTWETVSESPIVGRPQIPKGLVLCKSAVNLDKKKKDHEEVNGQKEDC